MFIFEEIKTINYRFLKIALIDHNDSFTFNIVEVLRHFKKCEVFVINYCEVTIELVEKYDKIILSPGPGLPKDYTKTMQVIANFFKQKPILGICLGQQMLGAYFGATIYNIKEVIHGVQKEIHITEKSKLFVDIPKKTKVGLYHSWAVNTINFPKELQITSQTKDGIIMSVEHRKLPLYGMQFHPESFLTVDGVQMIKNFIAV